MLLRNPFTRDARVLREARSLVGAGHDVTVLCLAVGGLPLEEIVEGIRVVRGVRTGRWAGPTISGAAGAKERTRLRRVVIGPAILVRDAVLDRAFIRAARALPLPDLVHAHDLNTLAAGTVIAKRAKARLIYDAHELYPDLTGLTGLERRAWLALERRLITRPDAIIVPTGARGAVLAQRYGIAAPTVVMNCPDPPAIIIADPRISELRRPGERLVCYAGGFTPNRGLLQIIEAVGSLAGARLVLIGWGPLEPTLRAAAAPFGDRIVFAGAVEPDAVVAAVAGADIGLVPYEPVGLNNELAAPNKLFEYLHAGLAVCGSDLPDLRTIIEGEQIGAVFDASDADSIRAAVATTLAGDLEAMQQRARELAPQYTWDTQARVLLACYDALSR